MENSHDTPYVLSIVVVVRNDNYGGDFTQRFQHSLDAVSYFTQKHKVRVELVLVDYNPVPQNEPFDVMVKWPEKHPYLHVKMIEVPAEMHQNILSDAVERAKLPVIEFNAKNAGIRRASSEFILCTNADIIFDEKLFEYLNSYSLDADTLYRADRFDFRQDVSSEDGFVIHQENIKKIYVRRGQYNKPGWMSFSIFKHLSQVLGIFYRSIAIFSSYFSFLRRFRHIFCYTDKKELFTTKYHLHASGDFTLMSKKNWYTLRAYPENTFSAMHTDSLLVIAAIAAGLREHVFPFPVFHQMHLNTFEHDASRYYEDRMFIRLVNEADEMLTHKKPLISNAENWGMGDVALKEKVIL